MELEELFEKQYGLWMSESGSTRYFERPGNMRQDIWWQWTALSNILILKELKAIRKILENKE